MINKTPKNKQIKLYGTLDGMFSNYFSFIVSGIGIVTSLQDKINTYQKHKLKPKNKL